MARSETTTMRLFQGVYILCALGSICVVGARIGVAQESSETGSEVADVEIEGEAPVETGAEMRAAVPEIYRGAVDIIPLGRCDVNLDRMKAAIQFADREVGQNDWHEASLLTDIYNVFTGDTLNQSVLSKVPFMNIEFHAVVKSGTLESTSFLQVMCFSMSYTDFFTMVDQAEELQALVFDENGFAATSDGDALVLRAGESCVVAMGAADLNLLRTAMVEALERFLQSPPRHAFAYVFEPGRISSTVRNSIASLMIAGIGTSVQRRDGEADFEVHLREATLKPLIAATRLLSDQIQSIEYSYDLKEDTQQICCELHVRPVPRSPFEYWLMRQHETTSRGLSWLHPQHDGFLAGAIVLPDVVCATLPALSQAGLNLLGASGMMAPDNMRACQQVVDDLVETGHLQFLLQTIPVGAGAFDILWTQPLPRQNDLTSAAIELVSGHQLGDWSVAFSDIDGWPVHVLDDFKSASELTQEGITYPSILQFCATDLAVHAHWSGTNSQALLSDVVRRDFVDVPAADRFRKAALALQVDCRTLLRRLDPSEDLETLFPEGESTSDTATQVTATVSAGADGFILTADFERGASAVGTHCYSSLLEMLVDHLQSR